jgi:hypothetical protein
MIWDIERILSHQFVLYLFHTRTFLSRGIFTDAQICIGCCGQAVENPPPLHQGKQHRQLVRLDLLVYRHDLPGKACSACGSRLCGGRLSAMSKVVATGTLIGIAFGEERSLTDATIAISGRRLDQKCLKFLKRTVRIERLQDQGNPPRIYCLWCK